MTTPPTPKQMDEYPQAEKEQLFFLILSFARAITGEFGYPISKKLGNAIDFLETQLMNGQFKIAHEPGTLHFTMMEWDSETGEYKEPQNRLRKVV